jgi:DNA-binding transcriptional LysR family regulator
MSKTEIAPPDFSGVTLDRLRALVAVVDAGGLARAAPSSAVRQSQLSRQIGELERWFGGALVARRGRGLAPTPLGAMVVEHARATLDGLLSLRAGRGAQVVLAAGDALLQHRVLPALDGLTAEGARLRVSILALARDEILARVRDGRVDVGIVAGARPARLRALAAGSWDCALFVPRAFAPAKGALEDAWLSRLPLAVQTSEPEVLRRLADGAAAAGVVPWIALSCETFPQVLRAVRTGRYAGVLPTFMAEELPPPRFIQWATRAIGSHAARLWVVVAPARARIRPHLLPFAADLAARVAEPARSRRG